MTWIFLGWMLSQLFVVGGINAPASGWTLDGTGGHPPQATDGTGGQPPSKTDGTGGQPPSKTDGTGGQPPSRL